MKTLVFITGFMGSGKSTISRLLAHELQLPLLSTDEEITRITGKSISSLFATRGETFFREQEEQLFETIQGPMVVDAGGGFPCFNNLIDRMNETGTTVFLEVPVDILAGRVKQGLKERPVLYREGGTLEDRITAMLESRSSCYQKCKFRVNGNRDPLEVAKEIAGLISN